VPFLATRAKRRKREGTESGFDRGKASRESEEGSRCGFVAGSGDGDCGLVIAVAWLVLGL
jgi:hypothetical protein